MQYSIDKDDFVSLKDKLKVLFEKTDIIHIDIFTKRKKQSNVVSKIEGVYDRFLCVSSLINSYTEDFTISYIDILTNKIIIQELN